MARLSCFRGTQKRICDICAYQQTHTYIRTYVHTCICMYGWGFPEKCVGRFVPSACLRRRRRQYIQDTLTIVSMHEPCKTSGSTLELVARLRASFSNWRVQPSAQPHESDHRLEQALEEILRLFHIVTSTCAGRLYCGRFVCKGKFGTIAPVWSWFPMRSIANIAKV